VLDIDKSEASSSNAELVVNVAHAKSVMLTAASAAAAAPLATTEQYNINSDRSRSGFHLIVTRCCDHRC